MEREGEGGGVVGRRLGPPEVERGREFELEVGESSVRSSLGFEPALEKLEVGESWTSEVVLVGSGLRGHEVDA